ncbi:MAG: hypothetical protein JZU53_06810 [Paludibacter sp.]|nr:hypothetical protein [Paludibacter sp.]
MDEYRFPRIPIVMTSIPVSVTSSSAMCGGNITTDFGSKVLFRGICWSSTHTPTVGDSISSDSFTFVGSGLGEYTSVLSGLSSKTTYHVRAYAVNANGVGYGKAISFTTDSISANVKQTNE